jgi:UDP-N-acetylmuramoylalanine--D-glutamate ligase
MLNNKGIFFKKKILIYGLGKSGLSTFKFLKDKNKIYLYDDKKIKNQSIEVKKN